LRSDTIVQLAACVVTIWGIFQAKSFLIPILLASLLSFLMAPVVKALKKKKAPEWAALTISSVVLCLPVIALVGLLVNESAILIRNYPALLNSLGANWKKLETSSWVQYFHLSDYLDVAYLQDRLTEEAGKGFSLFLQSIRALAEAGAHLVIILFFSVTMLASRIQLRKSAEKLFPSTRTLDEIIHLIEKFLVARIGIAVFVAVLDAFLLKMMGSQYCLILGCLLGLSTLVPIIGFILAVIPPIALSIAMGQPFLKTGLLAGLLYLVATIESHWATPKYLGRQLNLNLLATFLGLFGGEMIWGIWGLVLSIPLLGITRIILEASPENSRWAILVAAKDSQTRK
jgi:predicted PurR-regulated permease PerM